MVQTVQPLLKGWPPLGTADQMENKERATMARKLDLDIRQVQQAMIQPGLLDGQLAMGHDLNLVKYQHCQRINRVNLGARIWTAKIPRMRLKRVRCEGIGLEAQADTGANVTATNDLQAIFGYRPFNVPEIVQTFQDDNDESYRPQWLTGGVTATALNW